MDYELQGVADKLRPKFAAADSELTDADIERVSRSPPRS